MAPFKSKMPAGYGTTDEDGKSTTQDIAYVQDIEKQAKTLSDNLDELSNLVETSYSTITRIINPQYVTAYTFLITDAGAICEFANASAVTVTVPPNASVSFPIGTEIDVAQTGAGKVTFAEGSGVTIKSFLSNKSLAGQEAGATLYKFATDTWRLIGSLTP